MDLDAIALFRELADRSTSEREEYYARHHVSADLCAEVESLLSFDGHAADSLHNRVAAAAQRVLTGNAGVGAPRTVALGPGRLLGLYELVALIATGGMGAVYRARDPRLERDVAIKVLPGEFTSDLQRLRRFEQEARATAALSHPNILAIHDFGTTEPGIPYLVSELLEGETLRSRLKRGAVPAQGNRLCAADGSRPCRGA